MSANKRRPAIWAVLAIVTTFLFWNGREPGWAEESNGAKQPRHYGADRGDVWNRLHAALFIRTDGTRNSFGHDEVDILVWPSTSRHLVHENSLGPAIAALKEFNRQDASKVQARSLIARALLQRDLWAAFDWAAELNVEGGTDRARAKLRPLLHEAIRKIALTGAQIPELPDTYQQALHNKTFPASLDPSRPERPFLPSDLFDPSGAWVCIGETGIAQGDVQKKLAPIHVDHFSRSVFTVFLRLPEGRTQTLAYLTALAEFPTPRVIEDRRVELNKNLPELPPGTQVALLRRAILIDDQARPVPTRLVESLQLRIFDRPPSLAAEAPMRQSFVEFVLSPAAMLSGESGLRVVEGGEEGFTFLILRSSIDPFEEQAEQDFKVRRQGIYRSCQACHHDSGIRGLNVYTRAFGGHEGHPPLLAPTTPESREKVAVFWKQRRADWGLFRGMYER